MSVDPFSVSLSAVVLIRFFCKIHDHKKELREHEEYLEHISAFLSGLVSDRRKLSRRPIDGGWTNIDEDLERAERALGRAKTLVDWGQDNTTGTHSNLRKKKVMVFMLRYEAVKANKLLLNAYVLGLRDVRATLDFMNTQRESWEAFCREENDKTSHLLAKRYEKHTDLYTGRAENH